MGRLWFTSDTHFGHAGILYHRPFDTLKEMHQTIIGRWNELVRPSDEVWHLGDFAWNKADFAEFRQQLNGSIHLVRGNHDPRSARLLEGLFASVHSAHYLRTAGKRIYLHHYACRTWRSSVRGSWHLYGHSHGHIPDYGRSTDVGVDAWDFRPVSLEQLEELFEGRRTLPHYPESRTLPSVDCERCGGTHKYLRVYKLEQASSGVLPQQFWASCPATAQPLIITLPDKNQEHG